MKTFKIIRLHRIHSVRTGFEYPNTRRSSSPLFGCLCFTSFCVFIWIFNHLHVELLTRIHYSKYAHNSCTNYYLHRYETRVVQQMNTTCFVSVCLFVCFLSKFGVPCYSCLCLYQYLVFDIC